MYKKILTVLLLTGIVFSQQKIGIVFSEKIRLDFEEFKDVEQQLQLELEVIQKDKRGGLLTIQGRWIHHQLMRSFSFFGKYIKGLIEMIRVCQTWYFSYQRKVIV